ncbi:hypothetical protein [Komagataeibacter sp. NFXK3]
MGRPCVPGFIGGKPLDRTQARPDVLPPLRGRVPAMMPEDT